MKTEKKMAKKREQFKSEILVKHEDDHGNVFSVIIGTPDNLKEADADEGDRVAVYRLVRVDTYRTNPRLGK